MKYTSCNQRAAAMLYNSILDDAQVLIANPRIAPKEPLLKDAPREYRSLLVVKGRYKLIYNILEEKRALIVLVFACRQSADKIKRTTLSRM